jgi:hypothetical protein
MTLSSRPTIEGNLVFEEPENEAQEGKPAFAFVNVTGPVTKTTKSRSTMRLIRKHVMRDIGRSRRANEAPTVPGPSAMRQVPVIEDRTPAGQLIWDPYSSPRCCYTGCSNPGPYAVQPFINVLLPGTPLIYCYEHRNSLANAAITQTLDEALQIEIQRVVNAAQISKLGSGRIDPFIHYPVEMTPRIRRFVDHSE